VPPWGEARRAGRKVWRVWKWECRFVVRVFWIWEGVRRRRGRPVTVPALFIRIVGWPSCEGDVSAGGRRDLWLGTDGIRMMGKYLWVWSCIDEMGSIVLIEW
jgi:hypothetical protein